MYIRCVLDGQQLETSVITSGIIPGYSQIPFTHSIFNFRISNYDVKIFYYKCVNKHYGLKLF